MDRAGAVGGSIPMRTVLISTVAWASIWGAGGWIFGAFEENPKGEDSRLIYVPFFLPYLVTVAGTLYGTVAVRQPLGPLGAVLGTLVGAAIGGLGFIVFLAFRQFPRAQIACMVAGVVAGAIVGLISGALVRHVRIPSSQ